MKTKKLILLIMMLLKINSIFSQTDDTIPLIFKTHHNKTLQGTPNLSALQSGKIGFIDYKERYITLTKTTQIKNTWVGIVDNYEGSIAVITSYNGGFVANIIYDNISVDIIEKNKEYIMLTNSIEYNNICNELTDNTNTSNTESKDNSIIPDMIQQDILVAYTSEYLSFFSSKISAEASVSNAIAMANQAYINSNVNIFLNLILAVEVNYTESGSLSTDLSRLASGSDGYMDTIQPLMFKYGADLVHLLTLKSGGSCGVAYLSGTYGVTARSCISGHTFTHEVGHNQGCHHDRETVNNTISTNYNYGYKYCTTDGKGFRTIMSYPCSSGSGSRIPYFSNPNINYNGVPMGIDANVSPTQSADNARKLRETALTVSNRRTGVIVSPPNNPISVPIAPSELKVSSILKDKISLTWIDNSNNEDNFVIERSKDNINWISIGLVEYNSTSFTDVGLTQSTTYYYRIKAINSLYNSLWSNIASATTLTQTKGGNTNGGKGKTKTTILSPNPSSDFIIIDYNKSDDDIDYIIYDKFNNILNYGTTNKNNKIIINNLKPGIYYILLSNKNINEYITFIKE
jgi:hypothetical protein